MPAGIGAAAAEAFRELPLQLLDASRSGCDGMGGNVMLSGQTKMIKTVCLCFASFQDTRAEPLGNCHSCHIVLMP